MMKLVAFTTLVLLLAAVASASDKTITFASGGKAVFGGSSGEVKIFRNATDSGRFMKLRIKEVQEYDSNNNNVNNRKLDVESSTVSWLDYSNVVVGGQSARYIAYSVVSTLSGAAQPTNFTLQVYVFENSTATVSNGDESVYVPKFGTKINFLVSKWPFVSADNTLRVKVRVEVDNDAKDCSETRLSDGKRIAAFNTGKLTFAATAVYDGVNKAVNTTFRGKNGGDEVEFVTSFTSFTNTLVYDPVLDSNNNFGSVLLVSPILLLASLFVAIKQLF